MRAWEKSTQNRAARRFKDGGGIVKLKKTEQLVLAGEMPIRAPNGEPLPAVPVYMIIPAADADAGAAGAIAPNERLILAGYTECKLAAEERYNALITGVMPPKTRATPLYIKESVNGANAASRLTEGEQRALNPLIADLMTEFSAAMQEREAIKAV